MGGKGSGRKKGPTISKTRGLLYGLAKALGDVQAVKKGRVADRAKNRIMGKILGRILPW